MKIAPKAIREFLLQPDKACVGVLIYGPDEGLARERAQAIAAKILPADDPFARVELTEDQLKSDPALLSDELAALSLTATRRIVLLRDAGDKITKAVEAALPAADGNNFLVICAGELGPRSSLRQLFEANPKLAALPCYRDEAMDVQALIRRRFDEARIACGRDVMAYLTAHLGNDRGVTHSELDKIILYLGEEKTLTLEAAEALVDHNRDVTMDVLSNELATGNLAALDSLLAQAFREGTQPVALLRAAQRHFQRLYLVRQAMSGGASAAEAVAGLKPPVFFRQVPVMVAQAERWRLKDITTALERLLAAELACKQSPLSPALLASRAFTGVAQMKRSGAAA